MDGRTPISRRARNLDPNEVQVANRSRAQALIMPACVEVLTSHITTLTQDSDTQWSMTLKGLTHNRLKPLLARRNTHLKRRNSVSELAGESEDKYVT